MSEVWKFIQANPFVVGALSGSLATFLLSLAVEYLRRDKRWLGFSVASRKVVEGGLPEVSLRYKDRSIDRLYSHAITLRNIGNRALTNLPVRIEASGGDIVEDEVQPPRGARFPSNRESPTVLVIGCDLLNPGEVCTVGLTVVDSPDDALFVTARAEGVLCREISERIETQDLLEVLAGSSGLTRFALELSRVLSRTVLR